MKKLELQREERTDHYTEGRLYLGDELLADTLELPWMNNAKNISCISSALEAYYVTLRREGRYAQAYKKRWGHEGSLWIRNVAGREYILFHTGNCTLDTRGCVLVGKRTGGGRLYESRKVYKALYERLHEVFEEQDGVIPLAVSVEFGVDAEFSVNERTAIREGDL